MATARLDPDSEEVWELLFKVFRLMGHVDAEREAHGQFERLKTRSR